MRILASLAATLLLLFVPAHATQISFGTVLSGANEASPNGSPASGVVELVLDTTLHTLDISVSFFGLTANTTASHIHCCTALPMTGTAGVATQLPSFSMFPLGVTSGSFQQSLDLTNPASFNAAFITAHGGLADAEAALVAGLMSGEAYFNIHTEAFPGGEIRGFLAQKACCSVPEPATLLLLGVGLWGLSGRRRAA